MTPKRTREWQVHEVVVRADKYYVTVKAPSTWFTNKAEGLREFKADLIVALDEAAEYTFGIIPPGRDSK